MSNLSFGRGFEGEQCLECLVLGRPKETFFFWLVTASLNADVKYFALFGKICQTCDLWGVSRVFEKNHVVWIQTNCSAVFSFTENILSQEYDTDPIVVWANGEKVLHSQVVSTFAHEIVKYYDHVFVVLELGTLWKTFAKINGVVLCFDKLKRVLPCCVTVENVWYNGVYVLFYVWQHFSDKSSFAALRRAGNHHAKRMDESCVELNFHHRSGHWSLGNTFGNLSTFVW